MGKGKWTFPQKRIMFLKRASAYLMTGLKNLLESFPFRFASFNLFQPLSFPASRRATSIEHVPAKAMIAAISINDA